MILLETNKIYNQDCLDFMKNLPDNYFDLVITDPPYGIGGNVVKFGDNKLYNNKIEWDKNPPSDEVFKEILRVSKNQIIFGGNYFPILWSKPIRGFIFWDKIQVNDSFADGELAWTSFDRNARMFKYCYSGNRFGEPDRIRGVGQKSNRKHPTQKPVPLGRWLLQNYANKGDKIFDPFAGSGSFLVACKQLGYNFIGCDKEQKYVDIANDRLKQQTLVGVLND